MDLWSIGGGTSALSIMCILLYVKHIWGCDIPYIYGQLEEGYICPKYECILLCVKHMHCSDVPSIYGQLDEVYICPMYMCILLYVKHIQCSGIPDIYGQLEEPLRGFDVCAFCLYVKLLCTVVVFHTSMVNWRRRPWYMFILLYVKLLWCSTVPCIYGQLEVDTAALSISPFCYVLNIFSVVVFHTSMVDWRSPSVVLVYVHSAICETSLV